MNEIFALIVSALLFWSHPTNSITSDASWIAPAWGSPVAGTADAWPGMDGLCHIRISPEAWAVLDGATRAYTMKHEVGHCLGLWEPGTYHLGDGVMSGVNQMTAYDQFRIDAMHPRLTYRVVIAY